jgi:hypothetical protein
VQDDCHVADAPITVSEIAPGIGRIVVSLPLGVPNHLNCYVLLEERVLVHT